jgi:hypothetical protein
MRRGHSPKAYGCHMQEMPLVDAVLRHRFAMLLFLSAVMYVASARSLAGDNDWQFFTWGSDVLFGTHRAFVRSAMRIPGTLPGGLHIYANYPFLQIGPPGLLIAKALRLGPRDGLYFAGAATQALGLITVYATDRAFSRSDRPGKLTVLLGGGVLVLVWASLMHVTHVDDALALAAIAGALWALRTSHFAGMGALLGLSAASKPWAIVALALTLSPLGWRPRFVSAGAAALTVLVFWGPFLLADRETANLGEVHLAVSANSTLRAIGVLEVSHPQSLRFAQFTLGFLVAVAITLTRRWELALLAAFSCRLLIEPAGYAYYSSSIVAAALIADVGFGWLPVPIFTFLAAASWAAADLATPLTTAWIRLIDYCALGSTATLLALRARHRPAERNSPGSAYEQAI